MSLFLGLVLLPWISSFTEGSLLRGIPVKKFVHDAMSQSASNASFECDAYELDGLMPPDQDQIERNEWICERNSENTVKTFFFDANVEERFGADLPQVGGGVTMSIPWSAVKGTQIDTHHEGIAIKETTNNRRKLAQKMGEQKVLIVRVIGTDQAPGYWKKHIYDNFFTDENNLSSRFKECSKGKLNLIPATGPNVDNGIINVYLNTAVTGVHYRTVGDEVNTKLKSMNGLTYNTKIFIMPDAVDFKGGAAWAYLFGDTIWIRNIFSHTPMVQVHEYGHLLGLHHSGLGASTYSDNTGYMGNQLPWDDKGTITCFNPPKMWYLGWFEWRHVTVKPKESPFNDRIISLDDVVNDNADGEKMIVKIEGDENEFFIMYNKAKGINSGAIGYRDKIVITQQNGESKISYAKAGLEDGQSWEYPNFGGSGKKLVVTNCRRETMQSKDTAKLIIYLQGQDVVSCFDKANHVSQPPTTSTNRSNNVKDTASDSSPTPSSGTCRDLNGWMDSAGAGCDWYAKNSNCRIFGSSSGRYQYISVTANQACCACGGGRTVGGSSPTPSPSKSPTSSPSKSPVSRTCTNIQGWYDSGGSHFNCEWYALNKRNCEQFGHRFRRNNYTANEACCVCQ